MPGAYGLKGMLQDWRYYKGIALSAAEIHKIAMDTAAPALRTCQLRHEGGDSIWTDELGHGCAWYQETLQSVATICDTDTVKEKCPMACEAKKPCWEAPPPVVSRYRIWDRIMHLTEHSKGAGVICAREGIDLVAQCLKNKQNPDTSAAPGATGEWTYDKHKDIDVRDCEVLKKVVDPYCTFPTPGSWTKSINTQVTANKGYTIEWWWKATEDAVLYADLECARDRYYCYNVLH